MRMACNKMTTNGKRGFDLFDQILIFDQILSTSCSRKMYGDQTAELACGF